MATPGLNISPFSKRKRRDKKRRRVAQVIINFLKLLCSRFGGSNIKVFKHGSGNFGSSTNKMPFSSLNENCYFLGRGLLKESKMRKVYANVFGRKIVFATLYKPRAKVPSYFYAYPSLNLFCSFQIELQHGIRFSFFPPFPFQVLFFSSSIKMKLYNGIGKLEKGRI